MLDSLRFVQGAIAKKDFSPALTHFHIENGTVKGFNGSMALCGPIGIDLKATPKALPFVKAISTCRETTALHVQPNGKLVVQSGSFKAFVDCCDDGLPDIAPTGEYIETSGSILGAVKELAPFMADDASRQWACGILLDGQSGYATNNAVLVEKWLGHTFPARVCIPKTAIVELIRINEEPKAIQIGENSMTFHFGENKWLRTQLQDSGWPDIRRLLDMAATDLKPVPEGFFEAVEDVFPFADEIARLYFRDGLLSTCPNAENGANVKVVGLPKTGCFSGHFLRLLKNVAIRIDFDAYPSPCPFQGNKLRGVIVGAR